ncbi:MAG: hypothetical protein HZB51_06290 [Chloroflexi bacterium]|nr:hypothetical protein [Chloroflexota bacterium]
MPNEPESLRVFRDFRKVWEEGDLYQRKHLLGLVVEKVWVKGYEISAITLRPSYHLVVTGLKKAVEDSGISAEGTQDGNDNEKEKTIQKDSTISRWINGSDGHPALITLWKLLVAPATLIANPFQGCVED